jgi:DNA-binding transcriptional ArsR family regulator
MAIHPGSCYHYLPRDMLITTFYAVVGDEITYRIGLLLSRYALSVKEIGEAIDLPQPRISHKLAKLRKYGCVSFQRDGQRVIYRFNEPCRTILLSGDGLWRQLEPEFKSKWKCDHDRLVRQMGGELAERVIYPLINSSHVMEAKIA